MIAKRDSEQPTGQYSDADVDAAWETFQTKYLPYAVDGRSLYDFDDDEPSNAKETAPDMPSPSGGKQIYARGRRRLGRMAAFAAAIALLLGLMTLTAYAMGYDLWGVIAQWTKDTFTFVSASKANDAENPDLNVAAGEYADLQAALDAYGVTEQLAPRWIPDTFKLDRVYVDETPTSTSTKFYAYYRCNEQSIVIQINMHKNPSEASYATWQKDDMDVNTVEIADRTFYTMRNAGRECAICSHGAFECNISGNISSDELLKIIKSIFE